MTILAPPHQRPSWDHYFMNMASVAATRGSCDRLRVGAVIVGGDRRLLATGYNGAPANQPSCAEAGHEMMDVGGGRMSCVRTIHAEENAILSCARYGVSPVGGCLYTTASTCYDCLKRVVQVGIMRIVYLHDYTGGRNQGRYIPDIARQWGVAMEQLT